jgi:hypothetical protein
MPEEQRSDQALRTRLDQIEAGYLKRADENRDLILHSSRRTSWILGLLVVVQLGLGGLSIALLEQNGQRVDDIQQSRVDITYAQCVAINDRNRNTVAEYDRRFELARKSGLVSGQQLQRAKQSRDFTVGLVDRLVPVQDCDRQLVERFGPNHPKPAQP